MTQSTPQYSGKGYIESRIDLGNSHYEATASRAGAGMFLSIGPEKLIVTQRQGNGSYRNYFGIQVPETFFRDNSVDLAGDVEGMRRLLLSDFYADWADEYKDLIRHGTSFRAWPLYTLAAEDMGWKPAPGVTLAGDAAHLAIPNGEGVNLAMTDALRLASLIAEHGVEDADRAVREYEEEMFPRGKATIEDGKSMANVMYRGDPKAFIELLSVGHHE